MQGIPAPEKNIPKILNVRFIGPFSLYTKAIPNNKEESYMKTRKNRYYANDHRYCRNYPNAADDGYFAGKMLDGVTSAITGTGIVFILLFLLML